MKNYNILIVDDEKRLVQCLVFVLSLEGHNVITADDGEQALAILREAHAGGKKIDLLITDIFMPRMTGVNLLDQLIAEKLAITTIGISGYPDHDVMTTLNDKGCAALISKPFTPEELLTRINEVMDAASSAV